MKSKILLTGLIGLFSYTQTIAEVDFSASIEQEFRYYPNEGILQEQRDNQGSFAFEPEFIWENDDESQSFRTVLFGRYSNDEGNRNHADIRELYYTYAGSGWQMEIGINKVFWGVTESAHLVDIINQTDNVESTTGEEKLGQPMISFGIEQDWGNLDIYILPYFRDREFMKGPERFQFSIGGATIPIGEDLNFYESDDENDNIDYAIRWANYYGNLDIGISFFTGTNRDSIPIIGDATINPPSSEIHYLGNYYEQLDQLGIELQYIYEDWAIKMEATHKSLESGDYASIATGFEYTLTDLDPWGADLGLLVEYLWNDRDTVSILEPSLMAIGVTQEQFDLVFPSLSPQDQAQILALQNIPGEYFSPFENDIFFATRFNLNDINSTEFLAGIIVDGNDGTTSASFEGSTRIGDSVRVTLNTYFFTNVDEESAFYPIKNDDQIEFKVVWYF